LSSANISSLRPEIVGGPEPPAGPALGAAAGVGGVLGTGGVETGGVGGVFGSGTDGVDALGVGGVAVGGFGTEGTVGGFGTEGVVGGFGTEGTVGGFGTEGVVGGFGTLGVAGTVGGLGTVGFGGVGTAGFGVAGAAGVGVGFFLISGDFAAGFSGFIGCPESSAIRRSRDDTPDLLLLAIIAAKSSGDLEETSIPKVFRSFSALCNETIKSEMASFTSDITSLSLSSESYKKRTTLVTIFS